MSPVFEQGTWLYFEPCQSCGGFHPWQTLPPTFRAVLLTVVNRIRAQACRRN